MGYRCINDLFCYCNSIPNGEKRVDMIDMPNYNDMQTTYPFLINTCKEDYHKCKHKKTQSGMFSINEEPKAKVLPKRRERKVS